MKKLRELTNMKKLTRAIVVAFVAFATSSMAFADATPAPKVLMIMIDGLRADAVDTAYMPNIAKLRNGEWQPGYKAAWSLDAQVISGTAPAAGPNYVSIATGVGPTKHGVTSNANMAGGDYAPSYGNNCQGPIACDFAHPLSALPCIFSSLTPFCR